MRQIPLGLLLSREILFLQIRRERNVRHAAATDGGAARQVDQALDVRRTHDSLVEHGHILEQLVQFHILLGQRPDQIVEMHAGDRQHRLAVQLRVVKAVQQMNAAGARRAQTDTQLSGIFCVGASHEGGCLFVAHLNKSNLVLARPKRLHDAVDSVTRQPEHRVDTPIPQ